MNRLSLLGLVLVAALGSIYAFAAPSATKQAAKEFKIYVDKKPTKNGGYTVDHSAGIFVLDGEGRLRLFAQHNTAAPMLTADIRTLLKG